jgi:hypothetical protein
LCVGLGSSLNRRTRILAGLKRHGYEEIFSKDGGQEEGFRLKIRTEG